MRNQSKCGIALNLRQERLQSGPHRRRLEWTTAALFSGLVLVAGCFELLDTESLLPTGTPFVMSGTSTVVQRGGPCLVWIGENGITYHLFQSPTLDNETFDQINTPGTTSRLLLSTRADLDVACQFGTIVEVQDVLELVQ